MGFVDAFLNSYMQQQQLKQQRQEWEIQQALREADLLARQMDREDRNRDRDLDRELKLKSIEDMSFNRKARLDEMEAERQRKATQDIMDAYVKLIPMGYTPNQAKAIVSGEPQPSQYMPKPLKKQIGVEEGDALANAPSAIYKAMSQVLPYALGGVAAVPLQEAEEPALQFLRAAGAKRVDEQRKAIDIANEIIQENNAKGMAAAQASGDLPSPQFQNNSLNLQNLIASRNAAISDKIAQRELQRQALDIKAKNIADTSMREWEDLRRKWVKDDSEDYIKRDANEWRRQYYQRKADMMEELGKNSLELKKMATEIARGNLEIRAKELNLSQKRLSQQEVGTLVRIRGQALREVSDANKAVGILSRDEQSLLRYINDTITTLKTKEYIDDEAIIERRIQPLRQKLADVRIRLQAAKETANDARKVLQSIPGVQVKDPSTGKAVPQPKPEPPKLSSQQQGGVKLPKDLTKAKVGDMLRRLGEILDKEK